jgi:hypothetical protein
MSEEPLQYDDIPGSWGVYSANWPSISFDNQQDADRAFVACSKEKVVEYGRYVRVGLTLRIQKNDDRLKLLNHLKSPDLLAYNEVLKKYN